MSEKYSEFDKWWQKNATDMFWYRHRLIMGFDTEKWSLEETFYWNKVKRLREQCSASEDPEYAIFNAPYFDKQALLGKWWEHLTLEEKKEYLIHVWFNKADGTLYGFDWWLPFFEETGFITNTDACMPDEPITLYRGIEPFFKYGMSWTPEIDFARRFVDSVLLMGEKKLYKAVVSPDNILAILKGNLVNYAGELDAVGVEYVVNHRTLEDIQPIG